MARLSPGGGLCPPSGGRRAPDGALLPASPHDCAGGAGARTTLRSEQTRTIASPDSHSSPRVVRLGTVDSTQRYAAELAAAGAEDGTVVLAETQTEGRGRRGRVWKDVPGESLLMSMIVRSSLPLSRVPLLSLAVPVGVAEALIDAGRVDARLKWPNDVQIDGRKVAGILLERHGEAVLVGIGINVAQHEVPPALEAIATSVLLSGGTADREALLGAVLDRVSYWRMQLERDGFEPVRDRWMALTNMRGRHVSVDGVTGSVAGLDDDGALLLASHGVVTRVIAGEVQSVPRG